MKQKIKAVKDKMCWLDWQINGCSHHMAGVVTKLWKVRFEFKRNGDAPIRVRYSAVKDINLIKV